MNERQLVELLIAAITYFEANPQAKYFNDYPRDIVDLLIFKILLIHDRLNSVCVNKKHFHFRIFWKNIFWNICISLCCL